MVSEEEKKKLAEKLSQIVAENGYRIGTGFLSTGQILFALSDYGQEETAYRLLENRQKPGWLYSVTKGATTVWENWNGIDEEGKPSDSLNHYSTGSVVAWLFGGMCGIRIMDKNTVRIEPKAGGTLKYAEAEYTMQAGKIISKWSVEGNGIRYCITVPQGVSAIVVLPGVSETVAAGYHEYFEPSAQNS